MISLSAYFLDHERPELDRTEFTHPQVSGSLRAARGHAGRMHGFEGNFHWSSAVQALSILLLETKAWALLAPGEKEALPLPLVRRRMIPGRQVEADRDTHSFGLLRLQCQDRAPYRVPRGAVHHLG